MAAATGVAKYGTYATGSKNACTFPYPGPEPGLPGAVLFFSKIAGAIFPPHKKRPEQTFGAFIKKLRLL